MSVISNDGHELIASDETMPQALMPAGASTLPCDINDCELVDTLDSLDQGFLWLDENFKIKRHNLAYRQLLQIDDINSFVNQPYRDLFQFLHKRGEFIESDTHETFMAERLCALKNSKMLNLERVRPNGIILSVTVKLLTSGGYVYTYRDITREIRSMEIVRRNIKATVVALANFSEHRDTNTGLHVLRVARLVGQTARQLKKDGQFTDIINDAYIDCVGTASILHDIGKICMPDSILLKDGSLNDNEQALMRLHPKNGADLLNQVQLMMGESSYLKNGAAISLTHHEWFDGNGYPDGLSGTDIPLSGRICAIVDAFDALTSRRPYKEPWSTVQAIAHIQKFSGSQFDPVIVEAFLKVINERELVSIVQWCDSMSVGNRHIDEQHKILIDTINQLASAESQNERSLVAMIIDELVSYTAFHFQFEEQLMKECGYPDLESHKRIHQGFVDWITDTREEFIFHRRTLFGERILNFLRNWLRDHILGADQLYRSFINR
jgi:hemerythrin-like metal-binding protein